MARVCRLGLAFVLCLAAGHAEAAGAESVLAWEAPAACPSQAALDAEIARILGRASGPRQSVSAQALVRESVDGWLVTLALRTEETQATRTYTGKTCREAAAATALIVALAVDDRAQPVESSFSEPEPGAAGPASPPPPTPPTLEPVESVQRPQPRTTPSNARVSLGAFAVASVDSATLPGLTLGPGLGLVLLRSRWRFELEGSMFLERSASGSPGGDFALRTLGARTCWVLPLGWLGAGPCLAGRLVFVSASGTGADTSLEPVVLWPDLGIDALASPRLNDWLKLRVIGGARVPLRRPTFVVTELGAADTPIHRPSNLTFIGSLGLQATFF